MGQWFWETLRGPHTSSFPPSPPACRVRTHEPAQHAVTVPQPCSPRSLLDLAVCYHGQAGGGGIGAEACWAVGSEVSCPPFPPVTLPQGASPLPSYVRQACSQSHALCDSVYTELAEETNLQRWGAAVQLAGLGRVRGGWEAAQGCGGGLLDVEGGCSEGCQKGSQAQTPRTSGDGCETRV